MRRLYRYILAAVLLVSAAACGLDVDIDRPLQEQPAGRGDLTVIPRVTEYEDRNVATKSVKTERESYITSIYMFVFDSDDVLVDAQRIEGSKPVFIIDSREGERYVGHDQSKMGATRIVVVANLPESAIGSPSSLLSGHYTLADLEDVTVSASGVERPSAGFPMIGISKTINLKKDRVESETAVVEEIPLITLWSKIVFNVGVNALKWEEAKVVPEFRLKRYEIYNLPRYMKLGTPAAGAATVCDEGPVQGVIEGDMSAVTGENPTQNNGAQLSFSFYMPEHRVIPSRRSQASSIWPSGLPENERQRYKPLLCGSEQKPAYVKLYGEYQDHNGHVREVSYKVYLGEDNYQDFSINRNYRYSNNISILDLTNDSSWAEENGSGISVDHRVDVAIEQFAVYMERETQLDSHFEIRPMDIVLDLDKYPDSKVVFEIVNPSVDNWLRFEKTARKRDFFTTDLVSRTLAGSYSVEITHADYLSGNNRIWMYVDENTAHHSADESRHYGDGYRYAEVKAKFYRKVGSEYVEDSEHIYQFNQKDLYSITYGSHTYDIEFYEEYLHSYDPKDNFGSTVQGYIWGPDTKVSHLVQDIQANSQYSWVNNAINRAAPKYDFKDNYSGIDYTKEIVDVLGEDVLKLSEEPRSAAEYCYNKNKRDATGKVSEVHWYLPAIGEIQEIATKAYTRFDSFQDNSRYYWSSQTTYRNSYAQYEGFLIVSLGVMWQQKYTDENITQARATRTAYRNGAYSYAPSEVDGVSEYLYITRNNGDGEYRDVSRIINPKNYGISTVVVSDEGNRDRQEINYVRCVYKR